MPAPKMITYQEETLSLTDWSRRWGYIPQTLGKRIRDHGAEAAMRMSDRQHAEFVPLNDGMGRKATVNAGPCSEDDCEIKAKCRGLCHKHYRRLYYDESGRARRGHQPAFVYPIGATRINEGGYVEEKTGPRRTDWILQHRWVMQQHLSRPLTESETVHHKNGIKTDNRIENLELWASVHPKGQRVVDLLAFAYEMIERYEGDNL